MQDFLGIIKHTGQNILGMNYLKRFWTTFKEFLHKEYPETDITPLKEIEDTEPLGRYLMSKRHFSIENKRVKDAAFMPAPDFCLSVFRTQGLTEDEIWKLGYEEVVKKLPAPRTLYGRGQIILLAVKEVNLELDPDDTPSRHANIVGWPQEKSKQKLIALQLASEAILKLKT